MTDAARTPEPSALRPLLIIFGMPLILAVLFYGRLAFDVQRTRYRWADMDWNGDGRTTVREYFQTADVLERPLARDGQACTELFWARDGRSIRVECPANGRPPGMNVPTP
jgi:hypothetical protein